MAGNQQRKKGQANKVGRHFRINGTTRGAFPETTSQTKYVRSGGPARQAARKARNVERQAALHARAEARKAQRETGVPWLKVAEPTREIEVALDPDINA